MNGSLTYSHLGQTRTLALGKTAAIVGSSAAADLRISSPGMEEYHCALAWEPRGATWILSAPSSSARNTILINQRPLSGSTPLADGDVIALPEVVMRFHLEAAPPRFEGREQREIFLAQRKTLVLGRATGEAATEPKVELDAEDTRISRVHLVVEQDEKGRVFVLDKGRTDTFLNGQRFDRRPLAVGDRLRFASYAFEFTGASLRQIANATGAKIEAHHLTAVSAQGDPLVQDVTLTLAPCSLVGIVGVAQEQKLALLETLAGRLRITGGDLTCNGALFTGATPESWVPREDVFYEEFTVVETLRYRAALLLGVQTPPAARDALVDATIARVGLDGAREAPIARLSPVQRRRVTLAAALITHPRVLFLEEPTRDLDPEAEWDLLDLLRQIASADCTVICTTHLGGRAFPFDHLCVVHDGRAVFEGSVEEAKRFFQVENLEEIYHKLRALPIKPGAEWRQEFEDFSAPAFATTAFPKAPPPASGPLRRPGWFSSLGLSLARQWRRAARSPMRQGWALGAPILLGIFLGWVPADPVQRFFYAMVSLLWIGSARSTRLWAGDVAVLRGERALGAGTHLGLQSSLLFLAITSAVQATVLLLVMSSCARAFHSNPAPPPLFQHTMSQRLASAGHSAWPASMLLNAALTLDCAPNVLDATAPQPGAGASLDPFWGGVFIVLMVLAGKLLALIGASTLGVVLGLVVGAWLMAPARALLWTQIVILPQIVLAGVVVSLPEMTPSARFLAAVLPVSALQRVADNAHVYGQGAPRLSNRTLVPMFYDAPAQDELVNWEDQGHPVTEGYPRLSPWNRSWQNLTVAPEWLGRRHPAFHITRGVTKFEDFTAQRSDVTQNSGSLYLSSAPALIGLSTTLLWLVVGYGAAHMGLRRRMD